MYPFRPIRFCLKIRQHKKFGLHITSRNHLKKKKKKKQKKNLIASIHLAPFRVHFVWMLHYFSPLKSRKEKVILVLFISTSNLLRSKVDHIASLEFYCSTGPVYG